MTMTDERLAELDAVMAKATAGEWANLFRDIFVEWNAKADNLVATTGFGSGSLNDAAAIVALHNAYRDLRAHIDAQAATIARLTEELEKTTKPHFWWDVDDSENGCDDITSILDNYEIGEVVELSCARSLPNQWAVGYVTESGGFNGQTFATEAEAVAFVAARSAKEPA